MSVPDREIDLPEDKATCPACFFDHAPCDCPEQEENEE